MIFENYFYLLFGVGILTAVVSTAVGFLGGTILLAVMGQFIAPPILIPLHGVAQLWSNSARSLILRHHINWPLIRKYSIGAFLGAIVGGLFLRRLSADLFSLMLGVFVLTVALLPKENWARFAATTTSATASVPSFLKSIFNKWVVLGFVASALGLFVGAVGPMVGAFFLLEETMDKKEMIATQAVCQSLAHVFKVAVYLFLGFQLGPWSLFLGGMILSAWLGSVVGARVLDRIPGEIFMKVFKFLIVTLALRLMWLGIKGL